MEKLVCEICGGRLIMGQKDTFECESCGSCYSREWVKQKVQEIQGTVKVEGTVQVAGTVEVKGGVNLENLLKRGNMALEDGKWEDAQALFQDALNREPECSDAYLGLFLAERKQKKLPFAGLTDLGEEALAHYNRAKQFASPELKAQLDKAWAAEVQVTSLVAQGKKALRECTVDWEKAEAYFDQAMTLDPNNWRACYGKAMVSMKLVFSTSQYYSEGREYIKGTEFKNRHKNEYWQKARELAELANEWNTLRDRESKSPLILREETMAEW